MNDIHPEEVETKKLEGSSKFVFDKCCFCIPLRTGCLILAYLYLIATTVILIYTSVGLSLIALSLPYLLIEYKYITIVLIDLGSIVVVIMLILLIIGLHKENQTYVKLYLIFQLVYTVLSVLLRIVVLCFATDSYVIGIIIIVTYAVITMYYLLVVRSHYVKMGEIVKDLPSLDGHLVITSNV